MSRMCRPMCPFLLTYGSHDMRHTGFPQVDDGQRDPRDLGRHNSTHSEVEVKCHHQIDSKPRMVRSGSNLGRSSMGALYGL